MCLSAIPSDHGETVGATFVATCRKAYQIEQRLSEAPCTCSPRHDQETKPRGGDANRRRTKCPQVKAPGPLRTVANTDSTGGQNVQKSADLKGGDRSADERLTRLHGSLTSSWGRPWDR